MPRHSPYALVRLNFLHRSFDLCCSLNCLSFFVHIFRFAVKKLSLSHRSIFFLRFHARRNCFFTLLFLKDQYFSILCPQYLFVSTLSLLFGFQWTWFSIHAPNFSNGSSIPSRVLGCRFLGWLAQVDSNHRPRAYQARALTTWAMSPYGGDDGIRTHDPLLAGQVLSQLSYTPIFRCLRVKLPQNWTITTLPDP